MMKCASSPFPRTTTMSSFPLRSPSVGRDTSDGGAAMDDQGSYNSSNLVNELCAEFSPHDKGVVKSLFDSLDGISPPDGFKLLLVAAIVAHSRVTDTRLGSHSVGHSWRADMHSQLAEFCNIVEFPSIISYDDDTGDVVEIRASPRPVQIPPTPTPPPDSELVDAPMYDDDDAGTPLAPTASLLAFSPASLPPVPPPAARPAPPAPPALPPPAAKGKGKGKAAAPPPPPKRSYAAAASAAAAPAAPTPAPPPRASVVLSIPRATIANNLSVHLALPADGLALLCSEALAAQPVYAHVKVSAARWTPKGNLVIFGGPATSQDALLASCHVLTSAISTRLSLPGPSPISARANVKWGKVLVNGVPLQAPGSAPGVASSVVCHASLTDHNPSYAALKITQMPSWVRAPATYSTSGKTKSSLVVAFEDPDGSVARSLLQAKSLFIFGAQAKVRKWKYKAPSPNSRVHRMADARLAARVVASEVVLPDKPGAQGQAPSRPSSEVLLNAPRVASAVAAASEAQLAWSRERGDTPSSAAAADPSHRPPMPGPSARPLVHSPPSAPPGRKAKKAKKRADYSAVAAQRAAFAGATPHGG